MPARCAPPSRPAPLYFAEVRYGKLGVEFQATDRDKNSRAEIVHQIRNGVDVVRVLAVDEQTGTCRDVTEEILAESEEERDPRTLDEQLEALRDMLVDHKNDLRKNGLHGW